VEIEAYFTRQAAQHSCLYQGDPRWLRWLASAILTIGLGSAVIIYVTASPPPPYPLGYDPFTSKKYVRDLERYGGKINVLAVAFSQWVASLWHGQQLAYTLAVLTLVLACIVWFIGAHSAPDLETRAEK
jgi:hypothetical protein